MVPMDGDLGIGLSELRAQALIRCADVATSSQHSIERGNLSLLPVAVESGFEFHAIQQSQRLPTTSAAKIRIPMVRIHGLCQFNMVSSVDRAEIRPNIER